VLSVFSDLETDMSISGANVRFAIFERPESGDVNGGFGQLLPLRPAGFSSANTESRTDQE
jgi:hypothetical protein